MSGLAERSDERARRGFGRLGRTVVHRGELLRHPVYTRFVHWSVVISFVLALLSGFAIYTPWLYAWLTPLFGGGPTTRLLHPWFSVAFTVFFAAQFLNWFVPMRWTKADSRFLRRLRAYATNREKLEPPETGFFNGGQKLYFWAIVVSTVLFLVTGLVLWFDDVVGRGAVAISYVVHDVAAVVMLGGFILHVYEGTAAAPGTLEAMTRGTVTEAWAWTHHPAWYRAVTGREPREAFEEERRRGERTSSPDALDGEPQ
jgi:formate dehydrogenase subunit gamma